MSEISKPILAYIQAVLASTYMDVMEKEFPGFKCDVETAFEAADAMVYRVLDIDLKNTNNVALVRRANIRRENR